MFINLAPCNFQLELGTQDAARRGSHTIRCARKAFGFGDRIGITQNVSCIRTMLIFILLLKALPRNNGDDEDGNGAALLLLGRPIYNHNTIVRLTRLIAFTDMGGSTLNNNNFADVRIDSSASIAMTAGQDDADRGTLTGLIGLGLRTMIQRDFINFNRAIRIFALLGDDAFAFDDIRRFTDRARDRELLTTLTNRICRPTRYRNIAAKQAGFSQGLMDDATCATQLCFSRQDSNIRDFLRSFRKITILTFFGLFRHTVGSALNGNFLTTFRGIIRRLNRGLTSMF